MVFAKCGRGRTCGPEIGKGWDRQSAKSEGNEPFMGPGASGGRSHSAPGATENTIKQQPSGMKQGGHRSESSGQLSDGRPSESNPVTRQQLERNAEQGGGAAVAAEVLKEEGSKKHDSH